MHELRVREMVQGGQADGRVLWSGLWFQKLNNARYAELLPRLERLDALFLSASDRRVPRGLQYRAYRGPLGSALQRALFHRAHARYRGLFCTELRQVALYPGRVVVDIDDTGYTPAETRLLQLPNVAAYVVTTERAARRFEELGVDKPWHVISQGVSLSSVSPEDVAGVRAGRKGDGEVVIGYIASLLFSRGDAEAEHPLYGIEHLLELWESIRARLPNARLWLLGQASERTRRRLEGRPDVALLGWLPRAQALAHVASFDIALYPRASDQGLQAVKVAEYLGMGVPTVSYDHGVTDLLRGTGAAALVDSPTAFVDAVVRLAGDDSERNRLAAAARRAGAALDWDVLARRYEHDVLDRHLPG